MSWFYDRIIFPIKEEYYMNKKAHYRCTICGLIEAPFFNKDDYTHSITDAYGWHRFEDGRWVCHHCADHSAQNSTQWEWWHDWVQKHNEILLSQIKEKDPDYYEEWFDEEE